MEKYNNIIIIIIIIIPVKTAAYKIFTVSTSKGREADHLS
jgi:hypothetical protein